VGDGTPQALIPILTGETEEELPLTRKRYKEAQYVNVYPFIWKDFEEMGKFSMFCDIFLNIFIYAMLAWSMIKFNIGF